MIPADPYELQKRINAFVRYALQLAAAVYIGLEVAVPPDPYKTHLIVVLMLLIAHKYHIPSKMIDAWDKLRHSRG